MKLTTKMDLTAITAIFTLVFLIAVLSISQTYLKQLTIQISFLIAVVFTTINSIEFKKRHR